MKLQDLSKEDSQVLFQRAREIAKNRPTLFSMPVAFTTHCTIEPPCLHCRWRSMSKLEQNFGRDIALDEIVEKASSIRGSDIRRIHMPSGWMGYELPPYFYEYLSAAKKASDCEVFAFCGLVNDHSLTALKQAGADGYWCGLEFPNESLFKSIKPGDDYQGRIKLLRKAREMGFKTMSGFILGAGETQEDIINGLELLKELNVDSILISPFTPMPYTEMEQYTPPSPYAWARILAIATIYLEKVDNFIIPENASWGLRAGANAFLPVSPKFSGHAPEKEQLIRMRKKVYSSSDQMVKGF